MNYIINFDETKDYYDSQTRFCTCESCRNYRKVLPKSHPEVIEILSSFGLDFCREFEIIDYDGKRDFTLYEGIYAVFGTLLVDELVIYEKDDIKITIFKRELSGGLAPQTDKDFFMLNVWITLPWELPNE